MASPSKQLKIDDNASQTPLLIWLDSYADSSDENRNAQMHLRELNSNLKLFKVVEECEQFIKDESTTSRIVLIVSGGLGQLLMPRIADEEKIVSVYVYCGNKALHEKWAIDYPKIQLVTTKLFELIQTMKDKDFSQTKPIIEEPIDKKEINSAIVAENYEFNNRHIIADLSLYYLSTMKREKNDKDEFVRLCQTDIGQDSTRNDILQQFQQTDVADRVLSWFNRDVLFNRVLLKAFQYLNIESMYDCRYFIQDIQKYFNEHKHMSSVQVFRSLIMPSELLHELKSYEGKIIGIKSLLSTTCDRSMALLYHSEENVQKRVLFEIDADPQINGVKPFVKTSPSYESGLEDAIVFMIGSLFKINQVIEKEEDEEGGGNNVTVFQMTLCAAESIDLLKMMKLINDQEEKDFIGFIQLQYSLCTDLRYLDGLDNADKILENYLKKSELNDNDRIRAYDLLGNICAVKNQLDQSLFWYKEALNFKQKILSTNNSRLVDSYFYIACVYLNKHDHNQALDAFKQVLTISKQIHGEDSLLLMQCYSQMSKIYEDQEKFSDLLICYNQMFNILLKHVPIHDDQFAFLYNNMGKTFANLGQYSLALGYYKTSLDIKLRYQFPKEYIATNYKSIGIVHKSMGNIEQARTYLEQAITTYNQLESCDQKIISEIENLIQNLSTS